MGKSTFGDIRSAKSEQAGNPLLGGEDDLKNVLLFGAKETVFNKKPLAFILGLEYNIYIKVRGVLC